MTYADMLTHVPDTEDLLAVLSADYPASLDADAGTWLTTAGRKSPTVRSGDETIAYCRLGPAQVAEVEALAADGAVTILGRATYTGDARATAAQVYAHVLGETADPAAAAVYDRVYPRDPVTGVGEDGAEWAITPGEWLGVVA